MLSFFPRGVLDEILNLIESVSEEFPTYSTVLAVGAWDSFDFFLPPIISLFVCPLFLGEGLI